MTVARQVPLALRNALADRRRLVATALAVGLAVMLILILDGLWTGVRSQATGYSDRAGADLFVLPPDSRLLFSDDVTIPRSTAQRVAAVDGVRRAEPVRGQFAVLQLHGRQVVVNLVGSVPGHAGGPWSLSQGRQVRSDDEIVVDRVVADRHELDMGSHLDVLGRRFRIVGMAADSATFMTGFAFVIHHATDELFARERSSA